MIKSLVILFSIARAFAGELSDSKALALKLLESSLVSQTTQLSIEPANRQPKQAAHGLIFSINPQWQFTLQSKDQLQLTKITLNLNDMQVSNPVNIKLRPGISSNYLFASSDFMQRLEQLSTGYTILGIVREVSADNYLRFADYRYFKVVVTIAWLDKQQLYGESSLNFMLVMAK